MARGTIRISQRVTNVHLRFTLCFRRRSLGMRLGSIIIRAHPGSPACHALERRSDRLGYAVGHRHTTYLSYTCPPGLSPQGGLGMSKKGGRNRPSPFSKEILREPSSLHNSTVVPGRGGEKVPSVFSTYTAGRYQSGGNYRGEVSVCAGVLRPVTAERISCKSCRALVAVR